MRFAVIVHPGDITRYEAGGMPSQEMLEAMGKFNEELVDAGVMLSGEGFHPSMKGLRVHFGSGGKKTVINGPFAEANGLIGGFWLWRVRSKDEALHWAKRAPMEPGDTLEIRLVFEPADFDSEVAAQETALREKIGKRSSRPDSEGGSHRHHRPRVVRKILPKSTAPRIPGGRGKKQSV